MKIRAFSRRMKAMASAFYGRLQAYGSANSEIALTDSIVRNLYRGDEVRRREADALAHYISATRQEYSWPKRALCFRVSLVSAHCLTIRVSS